ncbi:MAG: PEP-CTERM sorting domain-containing protein [Opitutaceae bacterium]
MEKFTILFFAAFSFSTTCVNAALDYDFTDKGGIFDGLTTQNVLLSDSGTGFNTTMTVLAAGGNLNSNLGDFGVDGSEAGETNDWIDGTIESITLTFTDNIELNLIEFGGVGTGISDGVSLTIGASALNLFTGVSGFSGDSDIYTPESPIALSSGQSIIITGSSATSGFDLENFNITVVPEPGTYALLAGISVLGFVILRRRIVK